MLFLKISKRKGIQPPVENKWVKQLHAYILRFAACLQQRTNHLSFRALQMVFILCCVISSSFFSWIIVRSVQQKSPDVLQATPIRLPQHLLDSNTNYNSGIYTNAASKRFQQLLDSLMKLKNHDSLQLHLKK